MAELKYSRDKKVVFDPVSHTYTRLSDGYKLTSVTSVIKKIETPFDKEGKSLKKANELNITQQEVLDMWDAKAAKQQHIGNLTHGVFEEYFLEGRIKMYGNVIESQYAASILQTYYKTGRLKMIASEFILYNDYIAGQLDNLTITNSGRLLLIDFKTNDVLNDTHYNTFFQGKYSNIPQSKISIYTFQLNIYKQLFNAISKVKINEMLILHINKDGYRFIPIRDISGEVDLNPLLTDFKIA